MTIKISVMKEGVNVNIEQPLEQWRNILSTLTIKEAKVITARFGINCREPQTLEQVGQSFNVTRERIRQIEAKALRKLRRRAEQLNARAEDYLS